LSFAFTIDRREFDQALKEYAAASKRDAAAICNRQMLNLAIHGVQLTKEAETDAINKLQSKEWWPKYIAKNLSKKMFEKKVTSAFKRSQKAGERAQRKFMQRGYTRDQARAFSKKLIRRRLVAVGFLKFFFVSLGSAVKPYASGPALRGYSRKFQSFLLRIRPATPSTPRCDIAVSYDYRVRSNRTARKTERLLNAILAKAFSATAADMRQYIADKARRTAARHSARSAA